MNSKCIICGKDCQISSTNNNGPDNFSCQKCGDYTISGSAKTKLERMSNDAFKTKLSYWVRQNHEAKRKVQLTIILLKKLESTIELPKPKEQADILLKWIAENSSSYFAELSLEYNNLISVIGATSIHDIINIHGHLIDEKLIHSNIDGESTKKARMTMKGWNKYEKLKKKQKDSKKAFMAMQFEDDTLDRIFYSVIKNAVKGTGFDIRKLDEEPRAGIIDDKLRVEIRNSRFLIADLTHENRGAYWEAGYAEGFGLPVIYTCEESVFDDPKRTTHFDTNHHLTIKWKDDPGSLENFAEELKATIRATLPAEAIMEDDNEER